MASPPVNTPAPLPPPPIISGFSRRYWLPSVRGDRADIWEGIRNGNRVAIKYMRVSTRSGVEEMKRLYQEVIIWGTLAHPRIVTFLGVAIGTGLVPLCIVSPWMENGNMMEYLGINPEVNRPVLLRDICDGLQYLHSLDIVHGDVKARNILINPSGRACISEFGFATIRSGLEEIDHSILPSYTRAMWRWMAPELLFPETVTAPTRGPSGASDVYALGMTVVELFSGKLPFYGFLETVVVGKVMRGIRPERPVGASALGLSDEIWELVQKCWQQDRGSRPTVAFFLHCLRAETVY